MFYDIFWQCRYTSDCPIRILRISGIGKASPWCLNLEGATVAPGLILVLGFSNCEHWLTHLAHFP